MNMKGQEQLLGTISAAATHVLSLVTDIASAVKKMEKDVGAKQDDFASFQEKAVSMLKDTQDGLKLFCVLKLSGNWHPIINLRPMNKFVVKQRFKMETVQDVKELLRPGDYGATIDLQDAFYHVSVAERSRRYLRFIVDNTIYEFRALPMGLTCSPRIFTGINRVLGTLFRRRDIRVTFWYSGRTGRTADREYCSPAVPQELGVYD